MQSIVSGLRQEDDEGAQLVAVTDLCELLSISTEDNLASFPVEQITPLLVRGGRVLQTRFGRSKTCVACPHIPQV
jgi:hypothetical protein